MSAGAGGSRRCPAGPRHGPRAPCEGPGVGWGDTRRERPRGRGAPAGPRPRSPSPLRPRRRVPCRYIRRGAVGRGVLSGEAAPGRGGGRPNPPGAAPPRPPVGGGCSAGRCPPRRGAGPGVGGRGGSRPGLLRGRQPAGAELRASSPPSAPAWAVEAVGWWSPTAISTGGSGYPRPIALSTRAPCSWGRGDPAEAYGLPKHWP